MKKLYIIGIMLSIIAVSACKEAKKDQRALAGAVNMMKGSVIIKSKDGSKKAKIGDAISQGMEIITGKKSFVDIYFGNNAIKILENSSVKMSSLLVDKKGLKNQEFFVKTGRMFSRISDKLKKGESYQVKTSTVVAAVRGTDFMVEQIGTKSTISCLNGKLQVKKSDMPDLPSVDVNGGQVADVDKDKPIGIQELKGKNKENIENILKSVSEMRKDIRRQFEEERDKIRKMVKDEKKKNKEMVKKQIEKDKENIDKIKDDQKNERDKIKNDISDKKNVMKDDVQKQKDKMKIDKDSIKPKIDVNSFKPKK